MDRYKQNNCRICKKVFCCKKCREKHEISVHELFVKCNICIYGKTLFITPTDPSDEDLVKHIYNHHWPLHCLLCKRFFGSLEDLLKQNNCFMKCKNKDFEKNLSTPIHIENGDDNYYESPPAYFLNRQHATGSNNTWVFSNLATSTPLQRAEIDLCKKTNQQRITPSVDLSDINKVKRCYSECVSLQRRVTFYETSVIETHSEQENIKQIEDGSTAVFYSAKYQQDNLMQTNENYINIITPVDERPNIIRKRKTEAEHEDSTLWISAMNTPSSTTPADTKKQLLSSEENSLTQFSPKLKNRQINVVIPTTIRKKDVGLGTVHSTCLRSSETENLPILLSAPLKSDDEEGEHFFRKVDLKSKAASLKTHDTNKFLCGTPPNVLPPSRIWTSVNKLVRSVTDVVQEISNVTCTSKTPLKRAISEDNSTDGPCVKRYKLTEIKCRRPIRDLCTTRYSSIEYDENARHAVSHNGKIDEIKRFIDKATQTDR